MSEALGLRLDDLETFLHVARTSSVSAAARQLQVTVSQVSKSLARLERRLGKKLVSRSARGVSLTEHGLRVLPRIRAVAFEVRSLTSRESSERLAVTVAAPSFLLESVVPMLAGRVSEARYRMRSMGLAEIRAGFAEHAFDVAFLVGDDRASAGWVGESIGSVRNGLFGSAELVRGLGRQPVSEEQVRELVFIQPLRTDPSVLRPTSDGCPLPISERRLGDEVQTFVVGLELAACSDQVCFGPAPCARRLLAAGVVKEIKVKGWDAQLPVQMFVSENLPASFARKAIATTRAVLAELGGD